MKLGRRRFVVGDQKSECIPSWRKYTLTAATRPMSPPRSSAAGCISPAWASLCQFVLFISAIAPAWASCEYIQAHRRSRLKATVVPLPAASPIAETRRLGHDEQRLPARIGNIRGRDGGVLVESVYFVPWLRRPTIRAGLRYHQSPRAVVCPVMLQQLDPFPWFPPVHVMTSNAIGQN